MEIFVQLGADSSLLYQSIIVLVVLILSKILFLNHLENLLVKREEKTTGLEGNAEKQFQEIDNLKKQYEQKISNAHKEVKGYIDENKTSISRKLEADYKSKEKEVNSEVDAKREEEQKKAQAQKNEILTNADELSKLLVEKVTKG
jgi:F-type H+-transporting ATPase subunit b